MRLLELELRNFRVFASAHLELPARVIGIFGPNGSGKSTLMEAIPFACFGWARTDRNEIRTHGVSTDCEVRLVFEHGGAEYEVRRALRGRNHKHEAELLGTGGSLAVGVREVDHEIRSLLRMDQHVFRSSVFAEQKQLDAFSELRKGERKKMAMRLLGIQPVDEARAAARKEGRDGTDAAERLAGALPDLTEREDALTKARNEADAAAERRSAAERGFEEARGAAERAEDRFEELRAARERAVELEAERRAAADAAAGARRRVEDLSGRIARFREDLEGLPEARAALDALGDPRARLTEAVTYVEKRDELEHARKELARLPEDDEEAAAAHAEEAEGAFAEAREALVAANERVRHAHHGLDAARGTLDAAGDLDPSAPCPTCGQELAGGFEGYLAHCRSEVDRLGSEHASAKAEQRAAEKAEAEARMRAKDAKTRREQARSRSEVRVHAEATIRTLEAEVAQLAGSVGPDPDVESLRADVAAAAELAERLAKAESERQRLGEAEADLAGATEEVQRAEGRLTELEEALAALGFDAEAHEEARQAREEARKLAEEARQAEREAAAVAAGSAKAVAELEGSIAELRETAEKVEGLRDDARYAQRVSMLLDGFRDHLVARIGPELSREAEALFRELTNHEYEDLRVDDETLEIQIADDAAWFPIERFSGSETDLANLALRVAISAHLSRMSGADVGMMVLDEVLGSLDAERKDLMVEAMGRLAGRFHQLFVITHAEQVKERFPAMIEVRKVDRRRSEAVLA